MMLAMADYEPRSAPGILPEVKATCSAAMKRNKIQHQQGTTRQQHCATAPTSGQQLSTASCALSSLLCTPLASRSRRTEAE